MENTHIDKEARLLQCIESCIGVAITDACRDNIRVQIRAILTPLSAEGESSPKPEGLKWGCKIVPKKDGECDIDSPTGAYWLNLDEWVKYFPSDTRTVGCADADLMVDRLNACTTPPPDWQPHSSVTSPSTSQDNAEKVGDAGLWRERVKILSSIADEQACGCCERIVRTARKWFAEAKPEAGEHRVEKFPKIEITSRENGLVRVSYESDSFVGYFTGKTTADALRRCADVLEREHKEMDKDRTMENTDPLALLLGLEDTRVKEVPTPQPAEPKVMPDNLDKLFVGSLEKGTVVRGNEGGLVAYRIRTGGGEPAPDSVTERVVAALNAPQPSEQAKGAEWLPDGMTSPFAEYDITSRDLVHRDTQWRTFIESARAQHKAEMEAVKKWLRIVHDEAMEWREAHRTGKYGKIDSRCIDTDQLTLQAEFNAIVKSAKGASR